MAASFELSEEFLSAKIDFTSSNIFNLSAIKESGSNKQNPGNTSDLAYRCTKLRFPLIIFNSLYRSVNLSIFLNIGSLATRIFLLSKNKFMDFETISEYTFLAPSLREGSLFVLFHISEIT